MIFPSGSSSELPGERPAGKGKQSRPRSDCSSKEQSDQGLLCLLNYCSDAQRLRAIMVNESLYTVFIDKKLVKNEHVVFFILPIPPLTLLTRTHARAERERERETVFQPYHQGDGKVIIKGCMNEARSSGS